MLWFYKRKSDILSKYHHALSNHYSTNKQTFKFPKTSSFCKNLQHSTTVMILQEILQQWPPFYTRHPHYPPKINILHQIILIFAKNPHYSPKTNIIHQTSAVSRPRSSPKWARLWQQWRRTCSCPFRSPATLWRPLPHLGLQNLQKKVRPEWQEEGCYVTRTKTAQKNQRSLWCTKEKDGAQSQSKTSQGGDFTQCYKLHRETPGPAADPGRARQTLWSESIRL